MTRDELLQRLVNTVLEVLNASEEFRSACDHLEDVGLKRSVGLTIKVTDREPVAAVEAAAGSYQFTSQSNATTASDVEFLRSLRIEPDLEAR